MPRPDCADQPNISESLRCKPRINDRDCCTEEEPCQEGGGDCDNDSHCGAGLMCGTDNCLFFDKLSKPDADCCMNPCGEGFELIPGDTPGPGVLGQVKVGDTDECAELCLNNSLCRSYEYYSDTEKWCNLNKELKPTEPVWPNQVFCSLKGKYTNILN